MEIWFRGMIFPTEACFENSLDDIYRGGACLRLHHLHATAWSHSIFSRVLDSRQRRRPGPACSDAATRLRGYHVEEQGVAVGAERGQFAMMHEN